MRKMWQNKIHTQTIFNRRIYKHKHRNCKVLIFTTESKITQETIPIKKHKNAIKQTYYIKPWLNKKLSEYDPVTLNISQNMRKKISKI